MMTKKAQVIPLPIKEADGKYHILWTNKNGQWLYTHSSADNLTPQHLYFTTDDEIKGKGYRLDLNRMSVGVIDDDNYYNNPANGNFKKIVATTNKELWYSKYAKGLCPKCKSKLEIRLPETLWCENEKCDYSAMNLVRGVSEELVQCIGKIPTDFIEAYVREQGRIKEVLLEYEDTFVDWANECFKGIEEPKVWKLKLRPNGTVIIHPVKPVTYSAEEFRKAIQMAFNDGANWAYNAKIYTSLTSGDPIPSEDYFNKHYNNQ